MAFLFILPTWPVDVWTAAMAKVAPDLDVRVWPDRMGNEADIEYCAAWLPPPGVVKSLPNLKVIMSLGAGVDAILKDPTLPGNIPIVRVNDPDLTGRMTEYIVLHVLYHHRQQRRIEDNQKRRIWDSFPTHAAKDLKVGIMGLGVMGTDSALKLRDIGFAVAGWSQSRKSVPGVESTLPIYQLLLDIEPFDDKGQLQLTLANGKFRIRFFDIEDVLNHPVGRSERDDRH